MQEYGSMSAAFLRDDNPSISRIPPLKRLSNQIGIKPSQKEAQEVTIVMLTMGPQNFPLLKTSCKKRMLPNAKWCHSMIQNKLHHPTDMRSPRFDDKITAKQMSPVYRDENRVDIALNIIIDQCQGHQIATQLQSIHFCFMDFLSSSASLLWSSAWQVRRWCCSKCSWEGPVNVIFFPQHKHRSQKARRKCASCWRRAKSRVWRQ